MGTTMYKTTQNRHKLWNFHTHNYLPCPASSLVLLFFLLSSFTLRLVANRGSNLTLDILSLAVDNSEQRRVHSYTFEVKRLEKEEEKENETLLYYELGFKYADIFTGAHITLTLSLCVILCRLT